MRTILSCLALFLMTAAALAADTVRGTYVEARTCQVYTGPCFANGEMGSAGKDAVLIWQVSAGRFNATDLSGQSVAVILKCSHTLGHNGLRDAATKKALVIVNSGADEKTAAALRDFAVLQTGISESDIVGVYRSEIEMQFDTAELTATVVVQDFASLKTRKARETDCICSNEAAFYPPLTSLKGFVPGVTIEGDVTARRLGTRWSIPDSRTAYLGTFEFQPEPVEVAGTVK